MLKRRASGLWDDKVDKITLRDGVFRSPVPGFNQWAGRENQRGAAAFTT